MRHDGVQFLRRDPGVPRGFRTGVCLHGHTFRSKECLSFLPRHLRRVPGVAKVVRSHEKRIDFARAYWTPPLTPAAALHVERRQIAALGLAPIVSLTDHDDIEAGVSLQVACDRAFTPVSVEWTAPFALSIFHIGVHNLPAEMERKTMRALSAYTASPRDAVLPSLLEGLSLLPDVLVVLNHPFWLEEGIEATSHAGALDRLLRECRPFMHAFELNGTRPWRENQDTMALSRAYGRPIISGGDRHGCEPAASINLTNATSFAEFAAEIRGGHSQVLFMPQYQEPMAGRILETAWDILRPYPEHPDRVHWTDRFYYAGEDGLDRPLSAIWKGRTPLALRASAMLIELVATTGLRSALRLMAADRKEIAL